MTQSINIFQFRGCSKCFSETLLLQKDVEGVVTYIPHPQEWDPSPCDYAVITGYLLPEDEAILTQIDENAKEVIAFGSCTTTGGIFGLAYQNGNRITPLNKIISHATNVQGCLGEVTQLSQLIHKRALPTPSKLCELCSRKSTCAFLDEVHRQIDPNEDFESCFNDLGVLCSGYIAKGCTEMCVEYGTPCRGCKTTIDRPSFRMLGMFATLMANVEVASEATGKGGTDKLADEDDDVTASFPDVTGSFFRFNFANTDMPPGKIPSSGSIYRDVIIGRPIEEVPLILGCIGGNYAISRTLDFIETVEQSIEMKISQKVQDLREELRKLEATLQNAVENADYKAYEEVTTSIRGIAGNMNLSNLYFGGFKSPINGENEDKFADYQSQSLELENLGDKQFSKGTIRFSLNEIGVLTAFLMEKGE